jgi:hypothetical protein
MSSDTFDALLAWWAGVDPVFAFLLLLPVLVAACGLMADGRRDPFR